MPMPPAASKRLHRDRAALARGATAGDQAQDHGAERGNEAERQIAAAVKHERLDAREEIQEPLVEGVAQVGVLIPMRGEARVVVRPIRRNADGLVVEAGAGHG